MALGWMVVIGGCGLPRYARNDGLPYSCYEGVDFALFACNDLRRADDVDGFDAVAGVGQAVASAGQDFLVAGGVQVGKAFAEFELFAADVDVAVGGFFALHFGGQVVGINRQEPAHAGAFVFQIACGFLGAGVVHDVALQFAEDEVQHVVEVHADVGGHAKGFAVVAFPAFHVPLASAGDVGQLNIKFGVGRGGGDFVAQLQDGVVVAQLQDVVDAFAGFLLDQGQFVHQLGRGDQGFFADDVAAQAQACGDVRVVQVVGRADGHVVEPRGGAALQLVGKFLKALELGEEFALRRDAVDDADGVVDVIGHRQVVAQVFDGPHVAGCDVAGSADECEVFHVVWCRCGGA